jgi:hypothetical protein
MLLLSCSFGQLDGLEASHVEADQIASFDELGNSDLDGIIKRRAFHGAVLLLGCFALVSVGELPHPRDSLRIPQSAIHELKPKTALRFASS